MQNSSASSSNGYPSGRPTIIQFVEHFAKKFASRPFLTEKVCDVWEQTTYDQTRSESRALAAGLMDLGVEKGDRIALLSEGRKMWIEGELGLLYAGAVNVPLSVKLEQKSDLQFRILHSEAKYIMVSKGQLNKIRSIRPLCPEVKNVIVFDPLEKYEDGEIFIGELFERGRALIAERGENFLSERYNSILPDDYATISYTSGTVANPKGVLLTHRNYTANVEQVRNVLSFPDGGRMLVILPLDHCYAHVAGLYLSISFGCSLATVPGNSLRNIPMAIREFQPQMMLSVPTITKNFKRNIEAYIHSKGPEYELPFKKYLKNSYAYNKEGYNRGGLLQQWRRPLMRAADRMFFKEIRKKFFGGKLLFFVSGAAHLDMEQQRFFYAIGVPVMQGYGLSEATPIVSTNDYYRPHVLGTCGMTLRPMELEIRDENGQRVPNGEKGEICIKGENVMAGYWKNPEATADTIVDGWLHTGDMGYMWNDDFLCVCGRSKCLLISADGEKYSPEQIEGIVTSRSKFIDQIILYNSQSPYTIAFVVPYREKLLAFLETEHPGVDPSSDEGKALMLERLGAEWDAYRSGHEFAGEFPERWIPAASIVLSEHFSEANGQLNASNKVVRHKIEEDYRSRMAYAFTPEGKNIVNPQNLANI